MPQTEARARPKIATVERREARVPASWGRRRFRKSAKACRVFSARHVAGARHAPERLSALRHPSIGVELEFQTPGADAPREREVLCGWEAITASK